MVSSLTAANAVAAAATQARFASTVPPASMTSILPAPIQFALPQLVLQTPAAARLTLEQAALLWENVQLPTMARRSARVARAMVDSIVESALSDMLDTLASPQILALLVYTETAILRPKFATAFLTGRAPHAPTVLQTTQARTVMRASLGLLLWPTSR